MDWQFGRLILLTLIHTLVDFLGGMLGPILPAVRARFELSLSQGIVLITVLGLTCNMMQLVVGRYRQHNRHPFFLYWALGLSGGLLLLGRVPTTLASGPEFAVLVVLMLVTGTGVACGHPEGLRGVHALDKLPPSLASSFFMIGGFFGFSAGAWLASSMADAWGLGSLTWLLFLPVGMAFALWLSRTEVAVELTPTAEAAAADTRPLFWPLLAIAIPLTISSCFVPSLVPSCLHDEYGFSLSFGGAAGFAYGVGGAVGALSLGYLARKRGEMRFVLPMLAASVPLMAAYVLLLQHRWAVLILPGVGFALAGTYPLLVSLAKNTRGLGLGQRMAWIVGGAWGVAAVVLLVAGIVADHIGIRPVLHLTYLSAALSAVIAWRYRKLYSRVTEVA